MKQLRFVISLLCGMNILPIFAQEYLSDILFKEVIEVPVYQFDTTENTLTFRVDYAKPIIKNPKTWQRMPKENVPYQVDLIYTKYPFKFEDWRTNYDTLLIKRIENIKASQPLLRESSVRWRFILQTNCKTEPEAMKMFHGYVVYHHLVPKPAPLPVYEVGLEKTSSSSIEKETIVKEKEKVAETPNSTLKTYPVTTSVSPEISQQKEKDGIIKNGKKDGAIADPNADRKLEEGVTTLPTFKSGYADSRAFWAGDNTEVMNNVLSGKVRLKDSLVYGVFERQKNWKNILVVMDWTGSMYVYGAQLLLWHQQQLQKDSVKIKHFVLFNDGNKKPDHLKVIGKTGGIYFNDDYKIENIVPLMTTVMHSGLGGDMQENDMEAIIKGIEKYNDIDDIILVGDNSDVRDLELLPTIKKPIHVIICDAGKDYAEINPQYARIAFETGGSLHTINQDIYQLEEIYKPKSLVTIGGYYEMRKGKMVKVIK